MQVDRKAQVANAREEQQMSNENETQISAEVTCPRCEGCGRLANTDDREPWTAWSSLPVGSAVAVTMGLVKPEPCDECGGTGSVPAGEHHTGTLNLAGEGNEAEGVSPISDEAVEAVARLVFLAKRGVDWDFVWSDEAKREAAKEDAKGYARLALTAALPALRRQIAEEIAVAIERSEDSATRRERAEGIAGNPDGAQGWSDIATGYMRSAELAREIGSKEAS